MRSLYLILALIPVGIGFRYTLGLTEATRQIGIALAPPEFLSLNKRGVQDAVTPPESNKWFFSALGLTVGLVAWLWLAFGWLYGVGGAVLWFTSGLAAQLAVLPNPGSRHFVMMVFGSMSRRYADYERDGDRQRAMAMQELLGRFVAQYGDVIARGGKV